MRHELQAAISGPTLATRAEISALLARLSLHYWRPDYTPQQAALVVDDFVRDLTGVTAAELVEACDEYRRDPKNRFFPTPGQLLALLTETLNARARLQRGASLALKALDDGDARKETDRSNGPRDFAALRASLMAGKNLEPADNDTPPINTARTEKPESVAELRDTLARRQG